MDKIWLDAELDL